MAIFSAKSLTLASAILLVGATSIFSAPVRAEDSAQSTKQDLKTDVKKAGRKLDDATCPMVNGKLDCTAKRMKHGVQNAADDIKAKTN